MPSAPRAATGRPYGGKSEADRNAERTRRLFDAGLELFGTRGIAGVTVGEICAEAQLTKRYFYERYASVDEFVDAVMDAVVGNLAARVLATGSGRSGMKLVQERLAAFVAAITEDPRVARLVLVETFGASGSLGRLREQLVHRAVEIMIDDIVQSGARGVDADPLAVRMTAFAMSGASAELLLAWLEGDVVASADEIATYLGRLFSKAAALTRPRLPSVR